MILKMCDLAPVYCCIIIIFLYNFKSIQVNSIPSLLAYTLSAKMLRILDDVLRILDNVVPLAII